MLSYSCPIVKYVSIVIAPSSLCLFFIDVFAFESVLEIQRNHGEMQSNEIIEEVSVSWRSVRQTPYHNPRHQIGFSKLGEGGLC